MMNFEDFTENNYRKILNKINNKTIFYDLNFRTKLYPKN